MLDLSCPEKGGFWHSIRQCTLHLKISLKSIAGLRLDCFEIQVNKKTVCCWLFVFGPHSLSGCFEAGVLQQGHLWLSLVGAGLAPAPGLRWQRRGAGSVLTTPAASAKGLKKGSCVTNPQDMKWEQVFSPSKVFNCGQTEKSTATQNRSCFI